jgi:UDP-N-acetylmuramate dehydrogenase
MAISKRFQENIPLAHFSNYKIGGPARYFFAAKNEAEVAWAVKAARAKKLPIFILGGGTNLLMDDRGFKGLVLKPDIKTLSVRGGTITAGAGILMADLLDFSVKHSLSGFEWAGGLPGTLGGAIRGNAGCFGGEIKDAVRLVRSFDMKTGKIVERSARACAFGYRTSIFKARGGGGEVVLSAVLHMRKGDKKKIAKAIQEKIEYRKKNQPLEYPNVGSIFKNVPLTAIHKEGSAAHKKALRALHLVFRGSTFTIKIDPFPVISAAKLISEAGLRGVSCGGAMISSKHPNFIVNALNAGSPDVKNLIRLAKTSVYKKFAIELEEEVQIL